MSAISFSDVSLTDGNLGPVASDSPLPTLTINDTVATEGNFGTANVMFTISLSEPSTQVITVFASTSSGTATPPYDYATQSHVMHTIPAGTTSYSFSIVANGDTLYEADETFFVNLTDATNATLADAQGIGTIANDDPAPTLSIGDLTLVEGDTTETEAVFTVQLSAPSGLPVTVLATSADGTATAPSDYTAFPTTTLTFAPGVTTRTVTVGVHGDAIGESNETLFVNLTDPTDATLSDAQGMATITNNDTSTLTISNPSVVEGTAGATALTFTVTSPTAIQSGFTVDFDVADITTDGADYTIETSSPLTFIGLAGETQTITINVNGDLTQEATETLSVTLGGVAPVSAASIVSGAVGLGTIIDDDSPIVSIIKTIDGMETIVPQSGYFRAQLSQVSVSDTNVTYVVGGTATADQDYAALSGTVTILAGRLSADILVSVWDDVLPEDTETVVVTLTGIGSSNPFVRLDTTPEHLTATVNIGDTDSPVISSPATASVAENTLASSVVLNVDADTVPGHTFSYALSGSDATAFSINPVTGEIRFAASPNSEAPTDQDGDNVYNVSVSVTADFTPPRSSLQDLIITVTQVNDNAPQFVDPSATFSIPETSAVGTVVGIALAMDADLPAESLTYSIVSGNDSSVFAIDPATGEITVADATQLNFEVTPSFALTVRVTDNGSPTPLMANAEVIVNLINVPEGPTIIIPHPAGTYHLKRIPGFVSPDSTFTTGDLVNPDYSQATLTVSIINGRHRRDRLSIFPKGDGPGQINVRGHRLFFSGQQIGKIEVGHGNTHPDLVVTLNGDATTTAVDNLVRRISFLARTDVGTDRTIALQITNVTGVDSTVVTREIAVVS